MKHENYIHKKRYLQIRCLGVLFIRKNKEKLYEKIKKYNGGKRNN